MAIENDGTEFHGERLQRFGGIAVTLDYGDFVLLVPLPQNKSMNLEPSHLRSI